MKALWQVQTLSENKLNVLLTEKQRYTKKYKEYYN